MEFERLTKLTDPFFHHVENCRECSADKGYLVQCPKAEKLAEEIGRKVNAEVNPQGVVPA